MENSRKQKENKVDTTGEIFEPNNDPQPNNNH
jgi:hypothetical protein